MYYLSLAAVHKQEQDFLKEWIEYHLLVGVEHFYLCSNDDDPAPSLKILQPYIDRGIVDYSHQDGAPLYGYYNQCLSNVKGKSKWLGLIDLDEFIIPTIKDSIPEVLANYENFGGLLINWRMFGSSLEEGPKSQINDLLYTTPWACNYGKSIVQTERTVHTCTPHHFSYVRPYFAVNESFIPQGGPATNGPTYKDIAINHYWCRSKKFWFDVKSKRGKPDVGGNNPNWYTLEMFDQTNQSATTYDDTAARRFGRLLSERLA